MTKKKPLEQSLSVTTWEMYFQKWLKLKKQLWTSINYHQVISFQSKSSKGRWKKKTQQPPHQIKSRKPIYISTFYSSLLTSINNPMLEPILPWFPCNSIPCESKKKKGSKRYWGCISLPATCRGIGAGHGLSWWYQWAPRGGRRA